VANQLKGYDANQVLRSVFDVDKNCLRVCVVEGTTGGGGGFEVIITHTDDSIRLGDGSKLTTATQIGLKVGLDVNVINEVDIENLDASKDNVAIRDSNGNELDINSDGSISVVSGVNDNVAGLLKYNEVASVPSNVETTIVTHTAVGGRKTFLQKVSGSGDNVAKYKVKVNGVTIDMKRTMVGDNLNCDFIFDGDINPGYEVVVGDIISLTVINSRPGTSDYNGRIQYLEVI
jgi:hypothetical protein